MNNNHGWGLRSELWICLAMIIFFAITIILINKIFVEYDIILLQDNKVAEETDKKNDINNIINKKEEIDNNNYAAIEDKLVIAGRTYANKYLQNTEIGISKIVTVVRLQTENILETLEISNINCSGYIEIEKLEYDFKYYPYINCENLYKTVGYNEFLDNTDL